MRDDTTDHAEDEAEVDEEDEAFDEDEQDDEDLEEEYDEDEDPEDEEEDGAPARIPSNVLGPALFFGAIGLAALVLGAYGSLSRHASGALVTSPFALIVGVVFAAVAVGLWRGWEAARGIAILCGGVIAAAGLANPLTGGLCAVVFGGAMIWCLTRPDAKAWFGQA